MHVNVVVCLCLYACRFSRNFPCKTSWIKNLNLSIVIIINTTEKAKYQFSVPVPIALTHPNSILSGQTASVFCFVFCLFGWLVFLFVKYIFPSIRRASSLPYNIPSEKYSLTAFIGCCLFLFFLFRSYLHLCSVYNLLWGISPVLLSTSLGFSITPVLFSA